MARAPLPAALHHHVNGARTRFFQNGALLVEKRRRIDAPPAKLALKTADHPDQIGFVILDGALAQRYRNGPISS